MRISSFCEESRSTNTTDGVRPVLGGMEHQLRSKHASSVFSFLWAIAHSSATCRFAKSDSSDSCQITSLSKNSFSKHTMGNCPETQDPSYREAKSKEAIGIYYPTYTTFAIFSSMRIPKDGKFFRLSQTHYGFASSSHDVAYRRPQSIIRHQASKSWAISRETPVLK